MKASDLRFARSSVLNFWKHELQLVRNGDDEYTLKKVAPGEKNDIKFRPGVAVDDVTIDSRKVKSTFKFEGDNKLIQVQVGDSDMPKCEYIYEFTETEAITVSRRFFWH